MYLGPPRAALWAHSTSVLPLTTAQMYPLGLAISINFCHLLEANWTQLEKPAVTLQSNNFL